MSFDSMAAAVDWLDAYCAGDLTAILGMYADDAVIQCDCGGMKVVSGKQALRAYWLQRFKDYPAHGLDDLQYHEGGSSVSYITSRGPVITTLDYDLSGRTKHQRCDAA